MRRLLAVATLGVTLAACGSSGGTDRTHATTTKPPATGSITVDAAQSLAGAFGDIGKAFESTHPGTTIRFNFAGSAALVAQVQQGAPVDVFASADEANMQKVLTAGGGAGTPAVFARNELVIAVAPGNPKHIAALADLARAGTVVSLCAPEVPCGAYARQALTKAGVTLTPKSTETSVAGVLGRVSSGEADAGIVYVTDVRGASGKVEGVTIPAAANVVASYPVVVLKASANRSLADAFMTYIRSPAAQAILDRFGFEPA